MLWNDQQNLGLKAVDKWFYQDSKQQQIYRFFGFAGTGKTTLARHFAENIDGLVCFAAFTGKAALMMRKNGCKGASTIHRLIYRTEEDKNGKITFKLNRSSAIKDCSLIIIDECSMVDKKIAEDIMSFRKPILVIGDPAQLPPVSGAGYFTNAEPDFMLTEIHRQAKDNPIIYLATQVRLGERLKLGNYGESRIVSEATPEMIIENDQIIVGKNATRSKLNHTIRKDFIQIEGCMPVVGDKLICLRNNYDVGIFNGGMFEVLDLLESHNNSHLKMNLKHEDEDDLALVLAKVHKSMFDKDFPEPHYSILNLSQHYDYGYAITCHKSQGSQWPSTLVYDEGAVFRDNRKEWTYTALTRASERTDVVI